MNNPRRARTITLIILAIMLAGAASRGTSAKTTGAIPVRSDQASCDRASFRVILDVGHTVERHGVLSARGATEYMFNLRLANQIEQSLPASPRPSS